MNRLPRCPGSSPRRRHGGAARCRSSAPPGREQVRRGRSRPSRLVRRRDAPVALCCSGQHAEPRAVRRGSPCPRVPARRVDPRPEGRPALPVRARALGSRTPRRRTRPPRDRRCRLLPTLPQLRSRVGRSPLAPPRSVSGRSTNRYRPHLRGSLVQAHPRVWPTVLAGAAPGPVPAACPAARRSPVGSSRRPMDGTAPSFRRPQKTKLRSARRLRLPRAQLPRERLPQARRELGRPPAPAPPQAAQRWERSEPRRASRSCPGSAALRREPTARGARQGARHVARPRRGDLPAEGRR